MPAATGVLELTGRDSGKVMSFPIDREKQDDWRIVDVSPINDGTEGTAVVLTKDGSQNTRVLAREDFDTVVTRVAEAWGIDLNAEQEMPEQATGQPQTPRAASPAGRAMAQARRTAERAEHAARSWLRPLAAACRVVGVGLAAMFVVGMATSAAPAVVCGGLALAAFNGGTLFQLWREFRRADHREDAAAHRAASAAARQSRPMAAAQGPALA